MKRIKDFFQNLFSKDTLNALRPALQSAVAAAICYLIMKSLGMPEKFVGVLSAALIVKTSVGGTIVSGWQRVLATAVGCLIGIACISVIPTGYGTMGSLAISILVMNGIARFKSDWQYGVVAAIALSLGSSEDILQTATDRTLAIFLGSALGIVASLVVFPQKASTCARLHMNQALRQIGKYLSASVQATGSSDPEALSKAKNTYTTEISSARDYAAKVRIADDEPLHKWISLIARFESSVNIINRIATSTDSLVSQNDEKRSRMEELRKAGENTAKAIAKENQKKAEEHYSRFKELVSEIDKEFDENASGSDASEQRQAFSFGLREIEETLGEMIDRMKHDDGIGKLSST